jgi:protein-S-isoprenylcysteine O-methyltransferase
MASADATSPPAMSSRPASSSSSDDSSSESPSAPTVLLADLAPAGKISLTAISLESYILGALLGAGASWTLYFALPLGPGDAARYWRAPAFAALLAVFHFVEFYAYARWNLPHARRDSFLTRSNGGAYWAAMALGLVEAVVSARLFPRWQAAWSPLWLRAVGALLVVGGQALRHGAIAEAGTSFHHLLQRDRRPGHVLVTTGPYRLLRHPSYFGFYWWAVGTQVLLGNPLSTVMFSVVLWHFFYRRTVGECPFLGLFASCCKKEPVRGRKTTREMMWAR